MSDVPMVTVRLDDLGAVLRAADYMADRSLIGPVDRMSDAAALVRMRADLANESERHAGVVFGISHPGPSQMGCQFCIDTLVQGRNALMAYEEKAAAERERP